MNFVGQLIELGLNEERPIIGLTKEEINEIQIAQKVVLPTEFVRFLQQCGRSAGSYGRDVETFYHAYKVLKVWFFEAAEEFSTKMKIPPAAFFFSSYQGSQYDYFLCDEGPDPAVYRAYPELSRLEKIANSFSEHFSVGARQYANSFYQK